MIQPDWSNERIFEHLSGLPCWNGAISIEPLIGGLCNKSFVVSDSDTKYVARIGTDILVHNITQTSVQTSMRAAADIAVTPALRYAEPQLAVVDFLDGGCVRPEDIEGNEENCRKIVECVKRLHRGSGAVHGPLTYFWPFQVIRQYVAIGTEHDSRLTGEFPEVLRINDLLERSIEPFHAVFTHNDTVPQNFMFDQQEKIWLIDWDYGGFGHPMFDLVGIGCNADASEETDALLASLYFGRLDDSLERQLNAFRLILNLREYMWGMVQEVTSSLDSDSVMASMAELYPDQDAGYEGYTNMNRSRFEANWERYRSQFE